jgi:methyl-accepting chemotaxis protein
MEQVTQNNAAQTEQISSTAEALATEAGQLQELIGRFRVDAGPIPMMRGDGRQAPLETLPAPGRMSAAAHDTGSPPRALSATELKPS